MSQYLKNKIDEHKDLPEEMLQLLHNDASLMAALGVGNDRDFNDFFIISAHILPISKELADKPIDEKELAQLSHIVYTNRNEKPINNIFRFYEAVAEAMRQANIPIKKTAYPQGYGNIYIQAPHNMTQWLQTMREIYALANREHMDLGKAFNKITKNWKTMDRLDFEHWLSFYQGNNHLKYKIAQYHEVGDGAVLPTSNWRARLPGVPPRIPETIDEKTLEEKKNVEKTQEEQRKHDFRAAQDEVKKKLIARLTAAEKIFTNNIEAFKRMLGPEYSRWLSVLHEIKGRVQVATPVNAKSKLLEDILYKEANKLEANGLVKSAEMVRKIAQQTPPPPVGADPMATPGADPMGADPMGDLGLGDAQPGEQPGAAQEPAQPGDEHKAMEEFVRNMNGEPDPDQEKPLKTSSLKAEAQFAPETVPETAPETKSEKTPAQKAMKADVAEKDIENALKNVTITDLIEKLDGLAQAYRIREKTRQLTVVDLMMQQLGISSYFPNLSEAINKAFDSNQYILTRVEDILARLRGAATNEGGLQAKLQEQQNREAERAARKAGPLPEEEKPVEGPGNEMAAPATVEPPATPPGIR